MRKIKGIGSLIFMAIIILMVFGEIKCIVKFCQCDFEPNYKAEIVYGVGVVTGLGSFIGWMDFGK